MNPLSTEADGFTSVKPRIGVQISSFRHGPTSFDERVKAASEIGFRAIELIHLGPRSSPDPVKVSAQEAREALGQYGVVPVATHMPTLAVFNEHFEEITQYQEMIGNRNLVIAMVGEEVGFSFASAKVWAEFGKELKSVSARCADKGFSLGLHNHVLELMPVEGRLGILRIFDELDPGELFWEADVGHIAASQIDIEDLFEQIGERCRYIHVKDLSAEVSSNQVLEAEMEMSSFEDLVDPITRRIEWEVDLGLGVIDLDRVFSLARKFNVGWLLSENHKQGLDPKHAHDFLFEKLGA